MATTRGLRWLVRWGATFQNDCVFGLALDHPRQYAEPAADSAFVSGASGIEDSYVTRYDRLLKGSARHVLPNAPALLPEAATAWDGMRSSGDGLGVLDLIMWGQAKNIVRLYPDGRNLLLAPTLTTNGGSGVATSFTAATSAGLTAAYTIDGTELCQKVSVTANAGVANATAAVRQAVPCIPGETLTASAFLKTVGLTGGAKGFVTINWLDSGSAFLSATTAGLTTVTASYAQVASSGVAPAGAFSCQILAGFICAATGETGAVFVKQAMVERKPSASAAFIDSSAFKSVYLVEPMKGAPVDESPNISNARIDFVFRTTDDTPVTGY